MDFDLSTYYAEQEDCMSMPDESMEAYAVRLAKFKSTQDESAYIPPKQVPRVKAVVRVEEPPVVHPDPGTLLTAMSTSATTHMQSGRALKRKASASEPLAIDSSGTVDKRVKISDESIVFDLPTTSPPQLAVASSASASEAKPSASSPEEIDEIDSFSVSEIRNPVSRMAAPRRPSPRKKDSSTSKRATAGELTVHSPISSFSRTMNPAIPDRKTVPEIIPKNPPLDLRPLEYAKPLSKTRVDSAPYPPESESPTKTTKLVAADSSMLLMEIQERIAKHGSTKSSSHDKPAKVSPKPAAEQAKADSATARKASSSTQRAPAKPATSKAKEKPAPKPKEAKALKGKGKQKKELITHQDYVKLLMDKVAVDKAARESDDKVLPDTTPPRRGCRDFLAGRSIVYVSIDLNYASESSRKRMDIMVKHGASLTSKFELGVTTHIVTEYKAPDIDMRTVLNKIGLAKLSELPKTVPIVCWNWVILGLSHMASSREEMDEMLLGAVHHSTFPDRIVYPFGTPKPTRTFASFNFKPRKKSVDNAGADSDEEPVAGPSRLNLGNATTGRAEVDMADLLFGTGALPVSPPTSPFPQAGSSKQGAHPKDDGPKDSDDPDDPLAEYYEEAKRLVEIAADKESQSSTPGEEERRRDETDSDTDNEKPKPVKGKVQQKRGYACDAPVNAQKKGACPNQDVVDKLTELQKIKQGQIGDDPKWRAFSLTKSINAVRNYPKRIRSFDEACKIHSVGEKTAKKIMEIIETGALRRIKYENTEDVQVANLFKGVYDVGNLTAYKWYNAGCRTLDDLRAGKGGIKLTRAQKIGLQHYDDMAIRIPREEVKDIFDRIKRIALRIDPLLFVEVMGSYRRGQSDCGDIDILFTRPTDDGKSHSGVMSVLLRDLHVARILTDDLVLPKDPHDLHITYRGLCRVPDKKDSLRRRIDILSVPWKARGAALIYYTGDDIFNCSMRLKANRMGYSLNEHGLYKDVIRDPQNRSVKLDKGKLVASETEEEIFKMLGVPWKEPHQRALRRL